MATGIGPKRSLFKRRAGPVLVQKISHDQSISTTTTTTTTTPPSVNTNASNSTSPLPDRRTNVVVASSDDSDDSPPRPIAAPAPPVADPGIDLFRRAKHFYPKAVEASLRAGAKQQQQAVVHTTTPAGHDPKRRKVSEEYGSIDDDDDQEDDIDVKPVVLRSPSPAEDDSSVPAGIGSDSPARPRRDKGKGLTEAHTVNAGVVFANHATTTTTPPASRKRPSPDAEDGAGGSSVKPEPDDAVILLDDSDTNSNSNEAAARRRRRRRDESGRKRRSRERRPKEGRPQRPLDDDNDNIIVDSDSGDDHRATTEVVDPEFEEYILRARARNAASRAAREVEEINAQLAAQAKARQAGAGAAADAENSSESAAKAETETETTHRDPSLPPPPPPLSDQSYRIFITPRLPHPIPPPLIANVRMDQEMRYVKHAFLDHAREKGCALPSYLAKTVLLTWKGAKIYDFTTGLTLKLQPDSKGRFHGKSGLDSLGGGGGGTTTTPGKVSGGFVSGGLHIEIWTEELYEQYVRDQEKRRRRNMGEEMESDDDDDETEEGRTQGSTGTGTRPGSQQPPDKIRLVLASRDHEKLSVTAHSDTTIGTLVQAFSIQRGIAADKTITIWMDGEQLDDETTVGEAAMEDMDCVEVHIS